MGAHQHDIPVTQEQIFKLQAVYTDKEPEDGKQGERHNLNLRRHLARLGRKSLSYSKSVELHDKVIGCYLTIKYDQ